MKQELVETKPGVKILHPEVDIHVRYCNALAEEVQSHLTYAWHKGVILGFELTQLKARLQHGAWGRLFGASNSNHGWNFNFGQEMARRYMKLYEVSATRARELEDGERFTRLLEQASGIPAEDDMVVDVEDYEQFSHMLSEISGGATSMRQALFAFMNEDDEAPEAEKPKGKPLPHMRRLPKIEKPKEEPNYRDLYAAEWPGVLAVVETYITDRAPRLYQHDREQYAAQLRELAAAMAAAKGNIIRN